MSANSRTPVLPRGWHKGLCRWCLEPIDPRRHPRARTWHPGCVEEWKAQEPNHQRVLLRERDHEICAACGSSPQGRRARLQHCAGARYWAALVGLDGIPCPDAYGRWRGPEVLEAADAHERMRWRWDDESRLAADLARRLDREAQERRRLPLQREIVQNHQAQWDWRVRERAVPQGVEYDHVVPLWRGGVNHLDNLQTLCVPCHRGKTAREAAERAAVRRSQRRAAEAQMSLGVTHPTDHMDRPRAGEAAGAATTTQGVIA